MEPLVIAIVIVIVLIGGIGLALYLSPEQAPTQETVPVPEVVPEPLPIVPVAPVEPSFTVTEANNTFSYWHENLNLMTTRLPLGTFTASQLASIMTTYLNSVEKGWLVSWDSGLRMFIFENSAFRWDICNASAKDLLRLPSNNDCGAGKYVKFMSGQF